MITEAKLQAFWYEQAFGLKGLRTQCGQTVELLDIGLFNYHQGPDFLNARIKIDDVEWAGNVELHLKTSDWQKHQHHDDINFQSIILHVVWVNDNCHFSRSPILELSKFVQIHQLDNSHCTLRYQLYCTAHDKTPIIVGDDPDLLDLGVKRLIYKKEIILNLFQEYKMDYARVLWLLIFRCFGRTTNADTFENLFKSTPIHVLRLYAFDPVMLEALLMGQANLIPEFNKDEYTKNMFRAYRLLKQRHLLKPITEQMKWLRMRPRNFPTIRIAQLAAFYHRHISLVNELLNLFNFEDIDKLFDVTIQPYWRRHFLFDKESTEQEKIIGNGLRRQIIFHAFLPFLLAYGSFHHQEDIVKRAMGWAYQLQPEQNSLVQLFYALGFKANNILETQALHQLYVQHCLSHSCVNCPRGSQIYTD